MDRLIVIEDRLTNVDTANELGKQTGVQVGPEMLVMTPSEKHVSKEGMHEVQLMILFYSGREE